MEVLLLRYLEMSLSGKGPIIACVLKIAGDELNDDDCKSADERITLRRFSQWKTPEHRLWEPSA
jgi:hypothetical protein